MTSEKDWQTLFNNDSFVNKYFQTGEKITGMFASALIEQSRLVADSRSNPERPLVVLDNACGTGIISGILHHQLDDKARKTWKLTCGDISETMLAHTERRMKEGGWQNAETKLVDAQNTGLPSAYYTHIFTGFAYMALPDSQAALDETFRMLQPGGTIAFSTWIEPGWVSVVKKAVESMPGNLPFPTTQGFLSTLGSGEWNSVSWIESQLKQRGFEDLNVSISANEISLAVPELVEMAMVMVPMVTKHFWTASQREENQDKVRPALAKYLGDAYGKDGVVRMDWTAILSTARKPC